jgi:inorganic pyrophosphatase
MSVSIEELPAVDPDSGRLNVVVDTPMGSRNKYKFDEQSGQWRLSKVLPMGLSFPYDFGFAHEVTAKVKQDRREHGVQGGLNHGL